jgi:hypothetical protein
VNPADGGIDPAAVLRTAAPVPARPGLPTTPVVDVVGLGLTGSPPDPVGPGRPRWVLLLFVSANCDGCVPLWQLCGGGGRADLDLQVVAVARESDRTATFPPAPDGTTLVFSDEAFAAYRVLGAPFFVLVDRTAPVVVTEGVAWGADQVLGFVTEAQAGHPTVDAPRLRPPR